MNIQFSKHVRLKANNSGMSWYHRTTLWGVLMGWALLSFIQLFLSWSFPFLKLSSGPVEGHGVQRKPLSVKDVLIQEGTSRPQTSQRHSSSLGGRRKGSPRCRMFISLDPRHTEDNLRKSWGAITHNASGSETASNPPVVSWWTSHSSDTDVVLVWGVRVMTPWEPVIRLVWISEEHETVNTHSAACLHTLHNVTQPQWNMMFRLWFVPLSWGLCFHPRLFICLFVNKITQRQLNRFPRNSWGGGGGRIGQIQSKGWFQVFFPFLNHLL